TCLNVHPRRLSVQERLSAERQLEGLLTSPFHTERLGNRSDNRDSRRRRRPKSSGNRNLTVHIDIDSFCRPVNVIESSLSSDSEWLEEPLRVCNSGSSVGFCEESQGHIDPDLDSFASIRLYLCLRVEVDRHRNRGGAEHYKVFSG